MLHAAALLIGRDSVAIHEAGLRRVGLFLGNNLDTNKLRLIGKLLNESSMGNLNKLLIVLLPNVDAVFP